MKFVDYDADTQARILADLDSVPPNGNYHLSDAPDALIVRTLSASRSKLGRPAHSGVYWVVSQDTVILETQDAAEALEAALAVPPDLRPRQTRVLSSVEDSSA